MHSTQQTFVGIIVNGAKPSPIAHHGGQSATCFARKLPQHLSPLWSAYVENSTVFTVEKIPISQPHVRM
jgi:hypothetical protein